MAAAKRRGRKPNVATDVIVGAIFGSESGAMTGRELGITVQRANALIEQGVLTVRKNFQKVTDAEGNPSRGRPRRVYGLSKSARSKARRAAQASA